MSTLLESFRDAIEETNVRLHKPTFAEFVESGFPLGGDDRFSKFDIELAPWFRLLAKWIEDDSVEWIYLIQGSQTAKTTFLMAALLYFSQYASGPCPMFWASATEGEAKIFITDRLRPFLQTSVSENTELRRKDWKQTAFRVFNSFVKVGYASAIATMRSYPARILLGDEIGIWKISVEYFLKRARTFKGSRKGIFGSTPPFDRESPSWKNVKAANFFQIHVPCEHCGKEQYLSFNRIRWYEQTADERKEGTPWDMAKVRATARYHCEYCDQVWDENKKIKQIGRGKLVCVDPDTYEPTAIRDITAFAVQIPSTYSPFTRWGELAVNFLEAKAAGKQALDIFVTDELAECPKQEDEETTKPTMFSKYVDPQRKRGFAAGYDLYTLGVDVQGSGALYTHLLGFRGGEKMTVHVLDYQVIPWKDSVGVPDFSEFLHYVAPFRHNLYCCVLDATDGVTRPDIEDFCMAQGHPFYTVIDRGFSPVTKAQWKQHDAWKTRSKRSNLGQKYLIINSSHIKNDIVAAMDREVGSVDAWSFPSDTENVVFQHYSNEKRTIAKDNRGKPAYKWIPRYANAQQHFWSCFVYAVAAAEDQRQMLSKTNSQTVHRPRRVRSEGVSIWR